MEDKYRVIKVLLDNKLVKWAPQKGTKKIIEPFFFWTPEREEIKKRGPQENPNPKKKRTEIWMKTDFQSMGEYGKIFDISLENGMHNVIINTDHVFWKEFLSQTNHDIQEMFVKWFSSSSAALDKMEIQINIHDDNELLKQILIDDYHKELSNLMRKMILY